MIETESERLAREYLEDKYYERSISAFKQAVLMAFFGGHLQQPGEQHQH